MKKFVWQKVHQAFQRVGIEERFFRHPVVARFVMFQSVHLQMIAHRQQKIVMPIVPRAEKCAVLRHQLPQVLHLLFAQGRRHRAVRGDVQPVFRFLPGRQVVGLEKCAR